MKTTTPAPCWHTDPERPGLVLDEQGGVVLVGRDAAAVALASRAPALLDLAERAYSMAAVEALTARSLAEPGGQSEFDANASEKWAEMLRLEILRATGEAAPPAPAADAALAPRPAQPDPFYAGPHRVEVVSGRATLYAGDGTPLAVAYVIPHHEAQALATLRLWASAERLLAAARRVVDYATSLSLNHQPPLLALAEECRRAVTDTAGESCR